MISILSLKVYLNSGRGQKNSNLIELTFLYPINVFVDYKNNTNKKTVNKIFLLASFIQ